MGELTDCPFCAYVKGSKEPEELRRYPGAVAFRPLSPAGPGHTLVVPERHIVTPDELTDDEASDLWHAMHRRTIELWLTLQPEGSNHVLQTGAAGGQSVEHLHWHIVPRWSGDGLGYRWPD